jgi:hypothetical protein
MSKLLPKLMRLGRAGSKSDRAYAETVRHIDMITYGIELLQKQRVLLVRWEVVICMKMGITRWV